jgi:hypothetical protein
MYMGIWCAYHRRDFYLTHAGMASPLYWLMASVAMIKAAMQTVSKPTFWEKTVHGLFETTAHPDPAVELVGTPMPPPSASG